MTSDDPKRGAQTLPQDLVDALRDSFGDSRVRALFAKGWFLEGRFVPTSSARQLCSAKLFVHDEARVLARFSNFAGTHKVPDGSALARPHGLALKLSVPHEAELDIVAHSFNGFPTRTAAEFRDLLVVMGLSPSRAFSPTALERYLSAHHTAREFFANQSPPPESYATLTYYGVNAFKMVSARGEQHYIRYRFIPRAGERFLRATKSTARRANYLRAELSQRIVRGPIIFDWFVQIADPGDPIDDPSLPWPSERRLASLGTVFLTQIAPNQAELDRKTLFMPANLPDGICVADPMLTIRNAVYPLSYRNRQ